MEFAIGTEPRPEYLSYELAKSARMLVEEIFPVAKGENVLITADTASDSRVVDATAQAVYAAGAHPVVIWIEKQPNPCMDPPAPAAAAAKAANAWIDYTIAYMLYSPTHRQAIENGCRYLCYTGMDVDMMVRTIGRQNYTALSAFTAKIRELSTAGKTMRVTNPNGMDLSWEVNKNPPPPGFRREPGKGYSQMLGGQGHAPAVQDTINGTLVFDGAVWPPEELGGLRSPIVMTVKDGAITDIKGGAEARTLERWLKGFNHSEMFRIAHCSYGFNPGITRITGRIVEDERVMGSMEYGVGRTAMGAPSHTDGIVLNPSVYADGVPIEKEGVYVHPDLVAICKEMGVPGY
ncbi:MAG: hypothetical protein E6J26_01800 [Chloroflexi bacterium]|nr:MAG: hypothetical protein E6J26_01800 [Chloroflexota bacterium]